MKIHWVVVPFPSREMAESFLATEIDGWRANVIEVTPEMVQVYNETHHPDDRDENNLPPAR